VFAILNFFAYPADLSIGHLRAFLQPARETDHSVTPSVAWLTSAHRDALLGLDAGDARRRALEASTTVDMGETQADGTFPLTKQAELATASAPRRKVENHGFV
jgi:hypothetical protein